MTLADGPSDNTLFLLPPGGGELLAYHDLACALRGVHRVVGFELPGISGSASPLRDLDDAVAWFVAQIVAAQPEGPYLIAGYSLGAFLALDVARALMAQGQTVAFVGMIDPNPRAPLRDLKAWRARHGVVPLVEIARGGIARRWTRARMYLAAPWLHRRHERSPEQSFTLVQHHLLRMFSQWQPRPYHAPVTVLRAAGTAARPVANVDPDPVTEFATEATIVSVPGHHKGPDSLLHGPYVAALAAALRDAIARSATVRT